MSILADIEVMAELLVKNELIRIRPAEPCRQCQPGNPCFWHAERRDTDSQGRDVVGTRFEHGGGT